MLRFAEMALAAFAFIILTGTNIHYPLIGVPADLVTEEELLQFEGPIRNAYLLVYLVVIGLTVLNWKKMVLGMAAVWPIMALVGLAWLSILWSADPDTTQRRVIALTITTLMGVYLFVRFEFDDMLRFLVACFAILVIASLLWLVLFPAYAVHADAIHAGSWRGVFFHKNTAGRAMVFGLAVVMAAWYAGTINKAILTVIVLLALLLIAGTTSKTALIGLLVFIPGLIAVHMVRGAALTSAVISLTVLAIVWHGALLVYFTYEDILLFLGREPTLTGRTELWGFAIKLGLEAPLTGYGYDAFWSGDFSPGARYVLDWGIKQAHNAWIEVFVALGLPAVLMLLAILLTMTFRAVLIARYYPDLSPAVLIILVSFILFTIGMSESLFMLRHTIYWMLLIAVAGCARALTARLDSEKEDGEETSPFVKSGLLHGSPN